VPPPPPSVHQRAHALLPTARGALRARHPERCAGPQAGGVSPPGGAAHRGTGRGPWREPQWGVVGLAAPGVLVLGPVGDQQPQARGGPARDQALEQGLRLGLDPGQACKDPQQRLPLALPQPQALERRPGALAALRWSEGAPRTAFRQPLQERQPHREGGLQDLVERQPLADHLGAHRAGIVRRVEVPGALAQVEHRAIRPGLAVGPRRPLSPPPALRGMDLHARLGQPRFPPTGLPPQRHPLAGPSC
jgi:hypothetical protein